MRTHTIVVLGDGETWDILNGCSICVITDAELTALQDEEMSPRDLTPMAEIGLREMTPLPPMLQAALDKQRQS